MEIQDYCPTYITDKPVHCEHMALFLSSQTIRPDIQTVNTKCNIHGFNSKERAERNAKLTNLLLTDTKRDLQAVPRSRLSEHYYSTLTRGIRTAFEDMISKKKDLQKRKRAQAIHYAK